MATVYFALCKEQRVSVGLAMNVVISVRFCQDDAVYVFQFGVNFWYLPRRNYHVK